MKDYQTLNSQIIDSWCESGWQWGQPISHQQYLDALAGNWGVYLTPTKTVPKEWFGDLQGKQLLGLASGGGQQLPIFPLWAHSVPCWTTPAASVKATGWSPVGKATLFTSSRGI